MKSFHVLRGVKVLYLVLFLLVLGTGISIAWMMLEATRSISNALDPTRSLYRPLVISSLCSLPFLFIAAWFWLYLRAVWKARLIFAEQVLVFETIHHFAFLLGLGLRPFKIAYDQIKAVRSGGFAGILDIVDLKEKKKTLVPALFAGNYGEEVLIELRKHIPAENFMSGMEISEVRRSWSGERKRMTVFSIVFSVIYLGTFLLDPEFSSRSWLVDAWQVELHSFWGEHIWTYSPDSQGNFWVLAWQPAYYRVYRFSDKLEDEWRLPGDLFADQSPQGVSGDRNGNPIVWFEDSVYHHEGGTWQKIPYARGLTLGDLPHNGVVSGEQGWAVGTQGEDTSLLKIEALTGTWSALPLPESAIEHDLHPHTIRRALNGELLVLMSGPQVTRVYVLSGEQWQPQEYTVPVTYSISVQDYFLDERNALCVLVETDKDFVEKIDATGELHLTQLPAPEPTGGPDRYDSLLVDPSGRLWVSGSYPRFLTVFAPVWDETSVEIVRYTEENSNYQAGSYAPPILLPDGKIWAFRDRITTLDARPASLPAPLPAWFAAVEWNLLRMVLVLGLLFVYLILYLLSVRRNSPREQKLAA